MKHCPEGNAPIDLEFAEHIHDGEILICNECDEQLEVVFLDGGGYSLELAEFSDDSDDEDDDDVEWTES